MTITFTRIHTCAGGLIWSGVSWAFPTFSGQAKSGAGEPEEAIAHYREALRIDPEYDLAHTNLGLALVSQGKMDEAIAHYEEALRINPELATVHNNLAWIRATHPDPRFRNGPEAVELSERACRLSRGKDPNLLDTLAAAYPEAGRFPEAIATSQEAIAIPKSTASRISLNNLKNDSKCIGGDTLTARMNRSRNRVNRSEDVLRRNMSMRNAKNEICAGRVCRGRESRSPNKSNRNRR